MNKLFIGLVGVLSCISAQALTISPAVKIDTDGPAHNPVLSPDGKTLLFSSDNHTGLKAMSFDTKEIIILDDAPGAGFNPVFSTDGSSVVYRTAQLVDGLMNRDVRAYTFADNRARQLAPLSRNDVNLNDFSGHKEYVFADYDHIVIAEDGKTKDLSPLDNAHSYLWGSLSPDGSRILFAEPFQGVFVADRNGNNAVRIAIKGDYPAWASDNLVTFVVSHDDGYVILDSSLKVYDLATGVTVSLTPDDIKVGEATSSKGGKVVYSTLEGELYEISIN